MSASLLSIAGIPPLAGFYAKFLALSSALNAAAIVALFTSALSAANYLSLVKVSHFDLPKSSALVLCPAAVSYFISALTFLLAALWLISSLP